MENNKKIEEISVKSVSEALANMSITPAWKVAWAIKDKFKLDEEEVRQVTELVLVDVAKKLGTSVNLPSPGKKNSGPVPEGEKCIYILVRGDRAGKACDKKVTSGYLVCSAHKRSLESRNKHVPETGESVNDDQVSFVSYKEEDGLFKVNGTSLIVMRNDPNKKISKSNCECIGYLVKDDIMQLTDTHKKQAELLGLEMADE
ncbi:hypothetical protein FBU59_000003 [Linderina macrospora]|uniref:Uncharacterized protein n=1 Tax=Linderina macrospora TaxID=4868 RepID=A0ACC1JIB6_9FUNG|nr:hypothetical protein FBU59_000003 [Linderina macrospora]